jgi:photosystem II stability/assembly factor-like uncharacterized protein
MRRSLLGGVPGIVLLALFVSAGGSYGGQPFVSAARVSQGTVRLLPAPHPSDGPGLGPAHAAIVDGRLGFVATTGGGYWERHTGYIGPSQPGEIARTEDGGATWTVLWKTRHFVFDAVAALDAQHVYAVGEEIQPPYVDCCQTPRARPFFLATEDGGIHWRRRPLPLKIWNGTPGDAEVALQVIGPGEVAIAVYGEAAWSDDSGRSWRRISTPHGTEVVRFASPSTAYAGTKCVWKTRDGGTTWRRLPATCGPPVVDIDVNGRRVAVAQSWHFDYGPSPSRRVVRLSVDAGATWRVAAKVSSRRWPALVRVHFAGARQGWAVSQEWNQGWVNEALHRTTDGGATWQRAWYPRLPMTFSGSQRAWAGDGASGVLWRTADGARTWRATVRPENLGPGRLLLGLARRLIVWTEAGTLESRDAGRTWSPRIPPNREALASLRGDLSFVRIFRNRLGDPYRSIAFVRTSRGWRALEPPTRDANAAAAAFVDQEHGVVADGDLDPVDGTFARAILFATQDGGQSWRRIRIPPAADPMDEATLAPGLIALAWDTRLFVSLDDGDHWQRFRLPRGGAFDCAADRIGDEAWVSCEPSPAQRGAFVLTTDDGGRSWTRRRPSIPFDLNIAVSGSGSAWAISSRWGQGRYPHTLWHTQDGGRTWREVWASVPPDAVVTPASLRPPR